ncbi:terpene cyclase/mutase family protein [Cyanobacteria bacterium FACHB-63]|nr:terpene cyclase/mutase family protein [Cyanobacteria bacterium FACHB-63]
MTHSTLVQPQTERLIQSGLSFLQQAAQSNFAESRHVMQFPREQGFSSDQSEHVGDIFQRSLIAEVLLDAIDKRQSPLQSLFDREINYLLSHQRSTGVGGWSYFPQLLELPPDADDLAQMIQLLARTQQWSALEEHCSIPLQVLLQDGFHANGAIETWIVPAVPTTSEQQLQQLWIRQAWGQGGDPEVMANLLYALALCNLQGFSTVIDPGIDYLESQQQSNGSWKSTWYHGDYYGTYVCLRLLTLARPESSAIAPSIEFLRSRQLVDGSWGDPLNTAIALLGLSTKAGTMAGFDAALHYLQQQQNEDGGWADCPFIQMPLGRATGRIRQILSYGSRTMTTAFVVKALLCI